MTPRITLPSDQNATGRNLGLEELDGLVGALKSGTLTPTKGTYTKQLEARFAEIVGASHGYACSSGSMAVHCGVVAIDPEPGDEIITTPITDMGALAPIVYQGAIPVFADVDPETGNVTAETIAARISNKTKAVIVTHLFGNPCDMDAIMAVCNARGIPVIEDCAQAYGATWNDQHVGSFGGVGCFSMQQGKHITTGEGGLVVSSDDALARRVFLFINKAWGYGDKNADHYFLALNGRMSELVGAVGLAQLDKIAFSVNQRATMAAALNERLQGLEGITVPVAAPGGKHTYWRYCLNVDPAIIPDGPGGLAGPLRAAGIGAAPRYIQKPAFRCQVFAEQRTFGKSRFPFTLARPEAVDYRADRFPGAFQYLDRVLVLPFNEGFRLEHIDFIADQIHAAYRQMRG